MAESNAKGLPWPEWYELPLMLILVGSQDWEIELANRRYMRLGKCHLQGLYPVENWPNYWVDRESDGLAMERFWHDYHRTVTANEPRPDTMDIYPRKYSTSNDMSNMSNNVPTSPIRFPNLRETLADLLDNLLKCTDRGLLCIPYSRVISAYGIEWVLNKLLNWVDLDERE